MEIWEQIESDREVGARRLVAEYGDRLFRTAVALCKDAHIAEDLVFRTFERVIAKIDRFDATPVKFSRDAAALSALRDRLADAIEASSRR